MQGIRSQREAKVVEAALRPLMVLEMVGEAAARQSAAFYRELRDQGIAPRRTIDCLIATWCIQNRIPLLHADRDFRPFVSLGLMEV